MPQMTNPIKIAIHKPTDKFVHIDTIVSNDKEIRRHCYCLKCAEKLEAVLEFKDPNRIKFFRHDKNPNCEGAQETALHELAKQILVTNTCIATKEHGVISYTGAVAERRLEQKRPDISASYDDKPIYFEVYVTHLVDIGKEKFFIAGRHRSLEIDLSDCTTTSFDEIKKLVLDETSNKKIFFWQVEQDAETIQPEKEESFWSKYFPWIFAILIIFGLIKAAKKRNKR